MQVIRHTAVLAILAIGFSAIAQDEVAADPESIDPDTYFAVPGRPQSDEVRKVLQPGYELAEEFHEAEPYRRVARSVGVLQIFQVNSTGQRRTKNCTASLIDEDKIITARHCVTNMGGWVVDAIALKLAYLRDGTKPGVIFYVEKDIIEHDKELDYAILKVRGEPGKTYGFIEMREQPIVNNKSLFIVQHPQGYPQRLSRLGCRALDSSEVSSARFQHRCATDAGSSGALIFTDEDVPRPVGLHVNGGRDLQNDPLSFNEAVRLTTAVANSLELSRIKATLPPLPLPAERMKSLEDFVFGIRSIRLQTNWLFRGAGDTYPLASELVRQKGDKPHHILQVWFSGTLNSPKANVTGAILAFAGRSSSASSGTGPTAHSQATLATTYITQGHSFGNHDVAALAGLEKVTASLLCNPAAAARCYDVLDRVEGVELLLFVNEVQVFRRLVPRQGEKVQDHGDFRIVLEANIYNDMQSVRSVYEAGADIVR